MSFERTSGCIKNLSGKETITLDAMLDMLVCVSKDVLEYNHQSDVRGLFVSNQSLLLKMEYNLMQMLLLVDRENRSGLSEFGKGIQERYQNYAAELKERETELKKILEELELAEENQRALERKNKKLQEEIDFLQEKADTLKETERKALCKKEELENEITGIQKKVDEYQEWITQFAERNEAIRAKYAEQKAELTVMVNAWNSIKTDVLLQEALYPASGKTAEFSVKNHPDYGVVSEEIRDRKELLEWFDGMDQRIFGLLNVYESMLKTLVEQGEAITKKV